MKPQDYVIYRYDCKIYADYEHRTIKSPEKNYGTGTTRYQTIHKTGWEAVEALVSYCLSNDISVDVPSEEWRKYFEDMDRHLEYMIKRRGQMSESAWQMAFSCDAPNKPGYFRANND
jgi:hypothetical protein